MEKGVIGVSGITAALSFLKLLLSLMLDEDGGGSGGSFISATL
jgi:hypothetical protein